MELSAKVKKTLNITLRLLVALLAFGFIYRQVFVSGDFNQLYHKLVSDIHLHGFRFFMIAALVLMPINWGLEAYKWQRLTRYIEPVSFANAYRSVLTGISVSLFTPNRVGDFIGRVFTLKTRDPLKATLLAIAGSIAQILATLTFGMTSGLFFIRRYFEFGELWQLYLYSGLVLSTLILLMVLIMAYLRTPRLSAFINTLIRPEWKRIHEYIAVLQSVERSTLFKVLLLSLLRYVVFSTQFYLLLRAFALQIPYPTAFMLISVIYLVVTAIPTVALVDLGIRGSVSVYFLGLYFHNGQAAFLILSASTLIWIVNLALPALAGILFIYRFTLLRQS